MHEHSPSSPSHSHEVRNDADPLASERSAAGVAASAPTEQGKPPRSRDEMRAALADGMREDGTMEGHYIETYHGPCKGVRTDHRLRCLCVLIDDGATDVETRVLFETMVAEGWTPPPAPIPSHGGDAVTDSGASSEDAEGTPASQQPDEKKDGAA